MNLFLHVGMHKTATSSIQETIQDNENIDILYNNNFITFLNPSGIVNHSREIYSLFCSEPLKYSFNILCNINNEKDLLDYHESIKQSLLRQFKQNSKMNYILSGEDICLLSNDGISKIKPFFNSVFGEDIKIKIILCVREFTQYVNSVVQESIKWGQSIFEASTNSIITNRNFYENAIAKFINVFGRENCIIYKFEDAINDKYGAIGHFLRLLGLSENDISKIKQIRSNEGISDLASDIISYINEIEPIFLNDGNLNIRRNYFHDDISGLFLVSGDKFKLRENYLNKLLLYNQKDIKWLEENTGCKYEYDFSKIQKNTSFDDSMVYDIIYDISNKQLLEIKDAYYNSNEVIRTLIRNYFKSKYIKTLNNIYLNAIQTILNISS